MIRPYYDHAGIQIFLGDCREVLPSLEYDALVTDPPYPNNAGHFEEAVPLARRVLELLSGKECLTFWTELEHPPVPLSLVAVHIWHRANVNGRPYEPIYHFSADGKKRRSEVYKHPAIFDGAGPGCWEYAGHPTQKPVALMGRLVEKTTAGVICDPFCGVGATLIAAKQRGLRAIGVEIEERYCEIAARRLSQEVLDLTPQEDRELVHV